MTAAEDQTVEFITEKNLTEFVEKMTHVKMCISREPVKIYSFSE